MSNPHLSLDSSDPSVPPYFNGETSFSIWKDRMKTWLLSSGPDTWLSIEKGFTHPIDPITHAPKRFRKMSIKEADDCTNNQKALNSLYCALSESEYDRISAYQTAKEVWDTLDCIHKNQYISSICNDPFIETCVEIKEVEQSIDENQESTPITPIELSSDESSSNSEEEDQSENPAQKAKVAQQAESDHAPSSSEPIEVKDPCSKALAKSSEEVRLFSDSNSCNDYMNLHAKYSTLLEKYNLLEIEKSRVENENNMLREKVDSLSTLK